MKISRRCAAKISHLDIFSDFWMRDFFDELGRTRLLAFGLLLCVEGQKPRESA
jgi:hypothetical protein